MLHALYRATQSKDFNTGAEIASETLVYNRKTNSLRSVYSTAISAQATEKYVPWKGHKKVSSF